MIESWLAAEWPAPETICAGVTLRHGGNSTGAFTSLNLAAHVGDKPAVVAANRTQIMRQLQLPREPFWLQQVHGARVVEAGRGSSAPQADASYTYQRRVVCAVMTADCLPVLLCDQNGTRVAAVHAGWRGLLAGVLEHTVMAMQGENLLAWLGPAICADCFEVGNEVRVAYIRKEPVFAGAFQPLNESKWLADIYQLARIALQRVGVTRVYGGDACTVAEQTRYYSYRRDGQTGRMASLIWIR